MAAVNHVDLCDIGHSHIGEVTTVFVSFLEAATSVETHLLCNIYILVHAISTRTLKPANDRVTDIALLH